MKILSTFSRLLKKKEIKQEEEMVLFDISKFMWCGCGSCRGLTSKPKEVDSNVAQPKSDQLLNDRKSVGESFWQELAKQFPPEDRI